MIAKGLFYVHTSNFACRFSLSSAFGYIGFEFVLDGAGHFRGFLEPLLSFSV